MVVNFDERSYDLSDERQRLDFHNILNYEYAKFNKLEASSLSVLDSIAINIYFTDMHEKVSGKSLTQEDVDMFRKSLNGKDYKSLIAGISEEDIEARYEQFGGKK